MSVYGYARVSTKEQNEDRQMTALKEAGVHTSSIYVDKQSGKDFMRPEYLAMLQCLEKDDLLYIKSIDRLGRNYDDIQDQWRHLTKELKVDIVVLDMPLLDTRRGKDLMGTFLSDIVLQVLSFVAQSEREMMLVRQAEGIAAAHARGVRFGRPPHPLPDCFSAVCELWQTGRISGAEAARRCNMPQTSFRRRAKESGATAASATAASAAAASAAAAGATAAGATAASAAAAGAAATDTTASMGAAGKKQAAGVARSGKPSEVKHAAASGIEGAEGTGEGSLSS